MAEIKYKLRKEDLVQVIAARIRASRERSSRSTGKRAG
jgi:hypothetical protein